MTVMPYEQSITVADIPADEDQGGRVLLPYGNAGRCQRGMVANVGADVPTLSVGDVVYYAEGQYLQIGDVKVVPRGMIVAYEESE
jgi:hypothetical protein